MFVDNVEKSVESLYKRISNVNRNVDIISVLIIETL